MSEIKTPLRYGSHLVPGGLFSEKCLFDADGNALENKDVAEFVNAAAAREAQLREALVVATEAIGGPGATGSGECRR